MTWRASVTWRYVVHRVVVVDPRFLDYLTPYDVASIIVSHRALTNGKALFLRAQCRRLQAGPVTRDLHSSTSQLNLSHFSHSTHPLDA